MHTHCTLLTIIYHFVATIYLPTNQTTLPFSLTIISCSSRYAFWNANYYPDYGLLFYYLLLSRIQNLPFFHSCDIWSHDKRSSIKLPEIQQSNTTTLTPMPLNEHDLAKATKVIKASIEWMLSNSFESLKCRFLLCGGAPGIGNWYFLFTSFLLSNWYKN